MKITDCWVDVSHSIGVPFGAIGTGYGVFGKFGFVLPNFNSTPYVGKYTTFRELWTYDYLKLHGDDNKNFLSLLFETNEAVYAFQGECVDNTTAETADSFTSFEFLPFAKHTAVYEKIGAELKMLTYTPFIPQNLSESAIPVLCMEIAVKNNSDKTLSGELRFEFADEMQKANMKVAFEGEKEKYEVNLLPGETAKINAYFAWYYPKFFTPSHVLTEEYTRYYTLRFNDACDVVSYAQKEAANWKKEIKAWQDSLDFPAEFKRMWFSSLSSVITSTMMSTEPYFFEIETPHKYINTMDVTIYSHWIYMINWPEIEKIDMLMYGEHIPSEGEQKGLVWHSLWSDKADYVEEPCFITRIYRDYLWYNDKEYLLKMQRAVTDALSRTYDRLNDSMVESKHGNQSYDLWKMPGISAYVNITWLHALYSVIKMNEIDGISICANGEDAGEILKKAKENLVKYLWNEKDEYFNCFYRTEGASEKSIPESVFSDQMFGRWLLLIERNLSDLLPKDMVKKSIEYIYENNLIDDKEKGFRGWSNGRLPNKVPCFDNKQWHAKTCWMGAQLNLASVMGELGEEEKSLDIFRSIEKSLKNNHLAVGEWNQAITEEGMSCTLPEETSKDTPRFPSYPRYKSCWEYLIRILGLKLDGEYMELSPFKSFDFSIKNINLAECRLNVIVKKGWTKITVDGIIQDRAVFDRNKEHTVIFE